MKNRIPISKISIVLLMLQICTFAQIKLPSFVSDGMVLQRDIEIPVWGWASPGERVEVRFKGNSYRTSAGIDGKWHLKMHPQKAGGPYGMIIIASDTINLKNILIGDVWLCSGQSNMEFEMYKAGEKYSKEIESSSNDNIRQFLVKRRISFHRHDDVLTEAGWLPANPQNVLSFSAVAYFFARNLYEKYKVPIGLINSSYGGTPAEAWVSEEVLKSYPEYHARAVLYKDSVLVDSITKRDRIFTDNWYKETNSKDNGLKEGWMNPGYNSADWQRMQIPNLWQKNGLNNVTGAVVWFRREIDIPAALAGKNAVVRLGAIISRDTTYFNGAAVGSATNRYVQRIYKIDGHLIRPGKNLIAVRVLNENGDGGFITDKTYRLEIGGETIDLSGTWQYKLSTSVKPLLRDDVTRFQGQGASMYYGMLSPLAGYGIKGAIWYQGESNKGRGIEYRRLFRDLINSWRMEWGQGDFPFLFVQIANIDEPRTEPYDSRLAELQEAQAMALTLPNTGMAQANDLGEWNDVHPLNKADVGYRLFLNAKKFAYGEKNTVSSGPAFSSMKIKGNKIIITFINTGSGLIAKGGGELKHFAISDSSGKFVWAKAEIKGNKVIVWNESISAPVSVRYAWADNPAGANLYNMEGLPALPFRTDIP